MKEGAHLVLIAFPPAVMGSGASALVRDDRSIAGDVPPVAGRLCAGIGAVEDVDVPGAGADPVEKGAPRCSRLLGVEPLTHHGNLERVVRSDLHLLTPVRVEEAREVELEELREQATEGIVRLCLELPPGGAEVLRQLMSAQR